MKVYTKIEEFLATKPETKPSQPAIKPAVEPKPGTRPSPSKPSPIRRERPGADPKPMAKNKASEVVDRFMRELKRVKSPIKFDISKLKERYDD